MNKKLLAVAVAGALAAPGVALAQASSVTISGFIKVSVDQVSYSHATSQTGSFATGTANYTAGTALASRLGNQSETRVSDNSSKMVFAIREDLGNGLAAVAQADLRFNPSSSGQSVGGGGWGLGSPMSGSTWVGLQSATWGKLTFGRHDLHYMKGGDTWNTAGAGSLQSNADALFGSIGKPTNPTNCAAVAAVVVADTGAVTRTLTAAVGATASAKGTGSHSALASQSRTQQVVRWESPNWNGFDATIAFSANPLTQGSGGASTGGDLGMGLTGTGSNTGTVITRKGAGWNINPRYTASNWYVEYSYWNAKGDINSGGTSWANPTCNNAASNALCTTAAATSSGQSLIQDDQRSDVVAGRVMWNGWTFGVGWNRAKTTNVASGLITGDRSAWTLPISYTTGPHLFGFFYANANDSKDVWTTSGTTPTTVLTPVSGADSGAKMFTLTYQYDLSKRTALGLSASQLTNSAAANYNFFYNGPTAFGSANSTTLPGERAQLLAATIRHNF